MKGQTIKNLQELQYSKSPENNQPLYTYDVDGQQTLQSFQMHSFNNRLATNSTQPDVNLSESFSHVIQEIHANLNKIKEEQEGQDDLLKDMQGQGEKLGTAISFLRQFMFMNNINFDNSKFLQDQNLLSKMETEFSPELNKSNNLKPIQQKPQPQYFNPKIKQNDSINRRDKSPLNTSQQSLHQQSSQQSQGPSKLSGMLNSILQERKTKAPPQAVNKSSTSLQKKNY